MFNEEIISVAEGLPSVKERVIVVCSKFRCLGYLDQHKLWRYDSDNEEIEGTVIAWAEGPPELAIISAVKLRAE